MTEAGRGIADRGVLLLLGVCVVAGGAAGLVYEIVWARMLGVFLGASAPAHAIVLAGFLGGLALGNFVFGRVVDRRPERALAVYAALEAVVGVWGLLSPELFAAMSGAYESATAGVSLEASLFPAKLACSLGFVVVPAAAMGGTLPALARAVVRQLRDLGPYVARLYLANTAGATVGAFATGLIFLPAVGGVATVRWTAIVNLSIAIALGLVWLRSRAPVEHSESTAVAPPQGRRSATLLAVAALVGWASLTMEVAWTRVFAMVFGSSAQAFTLMLTVFLAGIALGSLLVPPLLRRWGGRGSDVTVLALLLAAAALVLVVQIPLYEHLPYRQFAIAQALERAPHVYPLYLGCQSVLAFAWMLPLTIATGAALPIVVHCYTERVESVGGGVGAVFASNTAGNVVGPLVATFLLFPSFGLRGAVGGAALGLVAAAAACLRLSGRRTPIIVALLAATTVGSLTLPGWDPSVMHAGGFRRWTLAAGSSYGEFQDVRDRVGVLFSHDGAADSVVVVESRDGFRFMKVNGKTDASDEEDLPTQRMVAHVPLLLHRAASVGVEPRVFVVGVGSGVTVGSAALHTGAAVVAAEISEGVLAASRYFDHVNNGYHALPNVTIYQGDARELLARSAGGWDVIINQPSNPWIAGNAALFSREFFVMARGRLAPGGIMAQWMHVYAMDDASVDIVMETFASVFPHVTVWWPQGVDLLLAGSEEPLVLDLDELRAGLAQPWLREEMAGYEREGVRVTNVGRLLALQVLSDAGFREAWTGAPPFTTDLWPTLEYRAPLSQFVGGRSERFVDVDERLHPEPGGGLYLFDMLAEVDVHDLLRFFSERDTPFSQRIAGSLVHAAHGTRPDADAFVPVVRRATGLPVILDAWAEQMAVDAPSADTCREFVEVATATYPARATRFYRPELAEAYEALSSCAELHPELAVYLRGRWVEILAGCGWTERARAEIDALLALPLPAESVEALEALRSEL